MRQKPIQNANLKTKTFLEFSAESSIVTEWETWSDDHFFPAPHRKGALTVSGQSQSGMLNNYGLNIASPAIIRPHSGLFPMTFEFAPPPQKKVEGKGG